MKEKTQSDAQTWNQTRFTNLVKYIPGSGHFVPYNYNSPEHSKSLLHTGLHR